MKETINGLLVNKTGRMGKSETNIFFLNENLSLFLGAAKYLIRSPEISQPLLQSISHPKSTFPENSSIPKILIKKTEIP